MTATSRELTALERDDQSVNSDGFCQRHTNDCQSLDAASSTWVTADSFHCLATDQADADCGTSTSETQGQGTGDTSSGCRSSSGSFSCQGHNFHHHSVLVFLYLVVLAVAHTQRHGPDGQRLQW